MQLDELICKYQITLADFKSCIPDNYYASVSKQTRRNTASLLDPKIDQHLLKIYNYLFEKIYLIFPQQNSNRHYFES